jgi:hypothetical protein
LTAGLSLLIGKAFFVHPQAMRLQEHTAAAQKNFLMRQGVNKKIIFSRKGIELQGINIPFRLTASIKETSRTEKGKLSRKGSTQSNRS